MSYALHPNPYTQSPGVGQHRQRMRHLTHCITFKRSIPLRSALTFLSLFAVIGLSAFGTSVAAQSHSYTSAKVEYIVDFPSPMWRLVDEPDEMHQHAEFVYNDRNDGYMRIRKEKLDEGL